MKKVIARIIMLFALQPLVLAIYAQEEKPIPVFTADSLASGNYKDVLTSFFQLAFDNLVGPEKDFKFTTNPYAIMMRANPQLAVDTSYLRYTALRNLNFGFSIRLDTSFKFNGFTTGINYAIINKRDHTVYRQFLDLLKMRTNEYRRMNRAIGRRISQLVATDSVLAEKMQQQWEELGKRNSQLSFATISDEVRTELLKIATDSGLTDLQTVIGSRANINVFDKTDEQYRQARDLFKNRLLWTLGVADTTYNDQFFFSNIAITTQVLKGFTNPSSANGLELDIKATYNFVDDTARSGRDLKRSLLNAEAGINYVRRSKRTDLSLFELKFNASYQRIFSGAYIEERKEAFTLNGTMRLRIFDDIWVPLKFQYDPKNGNVFGLLSIKANFTALKNVIAPKRS